MSTETTAIAGAGFAALPTAPAEIDLGALLERRARASAERPAVTFLGRTLTFAEVHDRVHGPRCLPTTLRSMPCLLI